MSPFKISYSSASILFICFILSAVIFAYKPWGKSERSPIKSDVAGYYVYLPAVFVYHDLNMNFKDKHPEIEKAGCIFNKTPRGYTSKCYPGLSLLYLPFFLLAHLAALLFGYEASGYSAPYIVAMALHPIFYLGIGLFYLSKSLKVYFADLVVTIVLLILSLSTNLFFYTTFGGNMSHFYIFLLFTLIIWLTIQWHIDFKSKYLIMMGALIGLCAISRPTSVIIILFPLLFNIHSLKDVTSKISKNILSIFLAIFAFITIISILLIYWKYISGNWFYYSYNGERFHFDDPHIFEVLVGFKKGWLIYTPVMTFSVVGLFWLKKYDKKQLALPIFIILTLHIYIISSWWCWWYGGSMGMRAMVEQYAILSFPLCAFIQMLYEYKVKVLTAIITTFIVLFTVLNLFQSAQYLKSVLWYDGLNYKAYKKIFGRLNLTEQEKEELKKTLTE